MVKELMNLQLGRMEGLANECYHLLANQRNMGASYSYGFQYGMVCLETTAVG